MAQPSQDIDQAAVEAALNVADPQPAQQPVPSVAEPILEDNDASYILFLSSFLVGVHGLIPTVY